VGQLGRGGRLMPAAPVPSWRPVGGAAWPVPQAPPRSTPGAADRIWRGGPVVTPVAAGALQDEGGAPLLDESAANLTQES